MLFSHGIVTSRCHIAMLVAPWHLGATATIEAEAQARVGDAKTGRPLEARAHLQATDGT